MNLHFDLFPNSSAHKMMQMNDATRNSGASEGSFAHRTFSGTMERVGGVHTPQDAIDTFNSGIGTGYQKKDTFDSPALEKEFNLLKRQFGRELNSYQNISDFIDFVNRKTVRGSRDLYRHLDTTWQGALKELRQNTPNRGKGLSDAQLFELEYLPSQRFGGRLKKIYI